jgi:hypothetical protein
MTAKVNFCDRREPAKMKPPFGWNEKGRFGKIVFFSDGLEHFITQPISKWANGSRITLEYAGCEGIDLILFDPHLQEPIFVGT